MTAADDLLISLTGGGAIPLSVGRISASWPFVRLEASSDGLCVYVTSKVLRGVFGLGSDGGRWALAWKDVDRVLAARHSIYIAPRAGRGCRFVRPSGGQIASLVQVLRSQGVEVVPVRTTFGKSFTL